MRESNGFYYMRARYYDPSIGRFISEDPSGFDGGDLNLYAYCNDNPINRVDPSGLEGRMYAPAWTSGRGSTTSWWEPTPERALRWTGRPLQETGYKFSGKVLGITGAALEPGGYGRMGGIIVGGTFGAGYGGMMGTMIAPGPGTVVGGIVGGVFGGVVGGMAGSLLDSPDEGNLY